MISSIMGLKIWVFGCYLLVTIPPIPKPMTRPWRIKQATAFSHRAQTRGATVIVICLE